MTNETDWLTQLETAEMVKVGVVDIDGVFRTKYLSPAKIRAAAESGLSFCNVIFQWDANDALYSAGRLFDASFGDAPARLDATTWRRLPWEAEMPLVLVDFNVAGSPARDLCPRTQLIRVVDKARSMGFTARFGPEYEWFIYGGAPGELARDDYRTARPATPGMFGYSGLRTGALSEYHRELFTQLNQFGVELEGLHTETGPGALEAAIMHREVLEAADRAMLFKQGVKQISYRHGMVASFMAKPRVDLPGCGGHQHQSLWAEGRNVFYDADRPHGMSKVFEWYIAGQLRLMPELMPLYAPFVNSYKRYVSGSWAATRANWGVDNRTTALRAIPAGPGGTRLETRVPGADANPYLVMAAALASGLYGIENQLELPHPAVEGSAYDQSVGIQLPGDLGAAAGAMSGGEHLAGLSEYLAPAFLAHFHRTRAQEWETYRGAVTDWERKRYFELA